MLEGTSLKGTLHLTVRKYLIDTLDKVSRVYTFKIASWTMHIDYGTSTTYLVGTPYPSIYHFR